MKLPESLFRSALIAAVLTVPATLAAQVEDVQDSVYYDDMTYGQPDADSIAYEYEEAVDYTTYNTALVRQAESGELWAQYCLGEIYEFGKGTQIDFEEMARWYIAAANHPEAYYHEACYAAGWCYENGEGIAANKIGRAHV